MKTIYGMTVSVIALATTLSAGQAMAQDTSTDDERTLNKVVVTGSLIRRQNQADLASPLTTVGAQDIGEIGAQSIADITQTLTINTGAQNNPDAFTQGGTTGTANINLRGLGLQSTLVLLNGKRNVLNGSQTNDGVSFVDTNSLVPLIAIDRVEILTDGASALYGSDAVAGVANFITVTDFDGVRLSGDYLFHTPAGQDQEDVRIEALFGKTFSRGSVLVAASWFDRTPLTTEERRLSVPFAQDFSVLGNPGAFIPLDLPGPLGALNGTPLIDPGCAANGGVPTDAAVNVGGTGLNAGVCLFDFGDFFNLVPDERRFNTYAEFNFDITDSISWSTDFSYTDNNISRGNSPTFPFLFPAVVTGNNPGSFFPDVFGVPVTSAFLGRAIGNGGEVSPAVFTSNTYRISTKLESDDFLNNGFWEISYTRAQNDFTVNLEDTITERFQCSLAGLQGLPAPNPSTGGATSCETFVGLDGPIPTGQFFNPFASSFDTVPNSPEILDFIIGNRIVEAQSNLDVVEAIVGTDLFELPAGPVSIAIGGQYRRDGLSNVVDPISAADGFSFLIGSGDFDAAVDVYAFFGEVSIPVTDWFDIQLAGRFEDFGEDGGTTVDPKVALLVRPTDWLSLRGTYSTSFRAPTNFQQLGQSTSLNNITDPGPDGVIDPEDVGNTAFGAVRAFGSQIAGTDLNPESSRAFTGGFTLNPLDGLTVDFDYYNIAFDDAITQVAFQALVNANPIDTRTFENGVATEPCDAAFTIVCRATDPVTGQIIQVNTNFANAEAIDTAGIDFKARYRFDAGNFGTFTPSFEGTYIINYDIIDPTAGAVTGAGSRNFTNIGAPTPRLRTNVGLNWSRGPVAYNFFARRIGSLVDDQNPGAVVSSQTRFDMQLVVDFAEITGLDTVGGVFSVGVTNLTNELPPFVATGGGFESRVHDPRGRIVRFGLDIDF